MKSSFWIFVVFLLFFSGKVFSQAEFIFVKNSDSLRISKKDTVITPKDTFIVINDIILRKRDSLVSMNKIYILDADTHVCYFDTIIVIKDMIFLKTDTLRTVNQKVFDRLKEFSEKKNIFAKLVRGVVIFDKPVVVPDTTKKEETAESNATPIETDGRVIRNIEIKVYNVFGPGVRNPNSRSTTTVERAGNLAHIKSHKWLIRNKLLFKEGQPLNRAELMETERLLRSANYIYDAKVFIKDDTQTDSVDIEVWVQDVWSITGGASYNPGGQSALLKAKDVNFLGLGQQFSNTLTLDPDLPKNHNYTGNYIVNNIYKTFFTGAFNYTYNKGLKNYYFGLNREFISPLIKWAGGYNITRADLLQMKTDSTEEKKFSGQFQDIWAGYSLNPIAGNSYNGYRIILSGRYLKSTYFQPPADLNPYTYSYHNSDFYLASIGLLQRYFYKDSYIFRLGRTEDIPVGKTFSLVGGIQTNKFWTRNYFGINAGWSRRVRHFGYLYLFSGYGQFYNHGKWEEGVLSTKFLYYTPLLSVGKWRWRNYLGFRYTEGINQLPLAYVNINKENGLRGLSSDLLRGKKKFVLNYETDFFPPLNLIGFRFGIIGFADLAWINETGKLLDKKNFFPGFGLGLRFKNEHLIFQMIQIWAGWYPKASSFGKNDFQFFEQNKFFYNYYEFQYTRPGTLIFN